LGSVNFHAGGEYTNFMNGWLNYQIEHHLFPDLPMSKYPQVQPKVHAVCLKYNVPYRQESVLARCVRMVHICIGETTMRKLEKFPPFVRH
jgi:fatty acid desaturase